MVKINLNSSTRLRTTHVKLFVFLYAIQPFTWQETQALSKNLLNNSISKSTFSNFVARDLIKPAFEDKKTGYYYIADRVMNRVYSLPDEIGIIRQRKSSDPKKTQRRIHDVLNRLFTLQVLKEAIDDFLENRVFEDTYHLYSKTFKTLSFSTKRTFASDTASWEADAEFETPNKTILIETDNHTETHKVLLGKVLRYYALYEKKMNLLGDFEDDRSMVDIYFGFKSEIRAQNFTKTLKAFYDTFPKYQEMAKHKKIEIKVRVIEVGK